VTMAQRIHEKATAMRSRLAVLQGARDKGKHYPNPEKLRAVMEESLMHDAIKLAIAEDVLAKPQLYGSDVAFEYRQRVADYIGEDVEL